MLFLIGNYELTLQSFARITALRTFYFLLVGSGYFCALKMKEEEIELPEEQDDDELFEHHRIVADPGQSLVRIDKFLMDRLPNVTRTKIQGGIHEGFVKVNEKTIKPNYKVHPNDVIVVALPEPPRDTDVKPENIALNIVFEDEHLLIINKPPGMVVHPAYQNWSGTVVNALAYHFQNLPQMQGNDGRPGLVHRIDKDTSGLLVIAKTETVLTQLAKQFFDHSIERRYWALVWGELDPTEGTINVNVGRSLKDRRVTVAFPDGDHGRHAITHYKLLKSFRYVSLVECKLETGRTHQIRAHMKYLGHPLFNDALYGGNEVLRGTIFSKYKQFVDNCFKIIPRQALHAKTLGFIHPATKKWVQFESELPEDMNAVMEKWEHYVKYN
jgi:23S rRNA pseudouridine1911/1915/1917 synthase